MTADPLSARLALSFGRESRQVLLALLLILAMGASSFLSLPRQEDPRLRNRIGLVLTPFPGASARLVESQVTEPLEDELREIHEVKELRSDSRDGLSVVTVELAERVVQVDEVWSKVRNRISDAQAVFPEGVQESRFEDQRGAAAFSHCSALIWKGDPKKTPWGILRRLGKDLALRLRTLPESEFVRLYGDPQEEVLVEVDPEQSAALGLGLPEIAEVLRASDSKAPSGKFRSEESELLVEVSGEFLSGEDLADRLLRVGPEGASLPLGSLARIRRGVAEPFEEKAWIDGFPGVVVAARLEDGGRIERWVERVRQELEVQRKDLGPEIELREIFDQSRYTALRLHTLGQNLAVGAGIVFLVIFAMMGFSSALLVGSALPLTLALVLFGLQLLGHPLHQMSITGLIISLGLLIDNAIVVVDEVGHRVAQGLSTDEAIRATDRALWMPLAGSTATTVVAFLPIVLLHGNIGEFIGAMGVSVVLSLLASFGLSTTLILGLGGRLAPRPEEAKDPPGFPWVGLAPGGLEGPYRALLRAALVGPRKTLLLALVLPLAGFWAFTQLPQVFFPPADRDQLYVQVYGDRGASLPKTEATVQGLDRLLRADPEVRATSWFLGTTGPSLYYNVLMNVDRDPDVAQGNLNLAPGVDPEAFVRRWQTRLSREFPEALVVLRQLGQGPPLPAPLEIRVLGRNLDQIRLASERVRRVLAQTRDVLGSRSSLEQSTPKLVYELDRGKILALDGNPRKLAAQFRAGLEGVRAGSILEGIEEVPVMLRYPEVLRSRHELLLEQRIPRVDGGFVPLRSIGSTRLVPRLESISRFKGERLDRVHGFLTTEGLPKRSLADFQLRWAKEVEAEPLQGVRLEYGGDEEAQGEAAANLLAYTPVLLVLMGAILVLSFGSFCYAGVLASVGVLSVGLAGLAVYLGGSPWGFVASVGTAGLIGVSLNDSIVVLANLVDAAAEGRDQVEDQVQVLVGCTRHVFSTTLTTMGGFLPLFLGRDAFWKPLASVMVFGVFGTTILALLFVPAAFRLLSLRGAGDAKEPSA